MAEEIDIAAIYDILVDDYAKRASAFGINRDGDIFQVACPICRTKKINHAFGGVFVCSRKHVFYVNTEDGVREITDDVKVLGNDLQKDGKDAHGHSPYVTFKPKEKAPVYLSYWFEEHNSNPKSISDLAWKLRKSCPISDSLSLDFMTEIKTMRGGKPIAELGSFIRTWPKFVNNRRWFVMMNQLAPHEEWRIGFLFDDL